MGTQHCPYTNNTRTYIVRHCRHTNNDPKTTSLTGGNITFKDDDGDISLDKRACAANLDKCSELFGVDSSQLEHAMLKKKIQSGRGDRRGSISFRSYTHSQAVEVRNGLAMEIYKRAFDWIVAEINRLAAGTSVPSSAMGASASNDTHASHKMIGILDIFGFEIFQKNSFEQLCINLCNEVLQQHFNESIFKSEIALYTREGITIPDLNFNDNSDVIELLIGKKTGCLPVLDEEGQVPGGSWQGYMNKLTKAHGSNKKFVQMFGKDKKEEFNIAHYAGVVKYDVSLFIPKNKDTLSPDIQELLVDSSVPFVMELFPAEDVDAHVSVAGGNKRASKQTVAKQFSAQLADLSKCIQSTRPQYVRCIKPNSLKVPHTFDAHITNEQVRYRYLNRLNGCISDYY